MLLYEKEEEKAKNQPREALHKLITPDETKEAIQKLKWNKSVGPGNFPALYYTTFQDLLIKLLTQVMNEIQQCQVLFFIMVRSFYSFHLQKKGLDLPKKKK